MTSDQDLRARLAASEDARRAAEAALNESQRVARVGSWTWQPGPDIVSWSGEMFRIAGRDPRLGAPSYAEQASMFSRPDLLAAAVDGLLRTGRPFEVELGLLRPDGQERWIVARGEAVTNASGQVIRVNGTARDVTDGRAHREALQAAHDKLERSERRYRDLVENLVDVVFSLDLEGRFEYVSPAVDRFGYTVEGMIGRHFTEFLHADDRTAGEIAFRNTVGGNNDPSELRLVDSGGATRYVQVSARAVYEEARLVGLTGVAVDVTEQRRAEDQLRVAQRLEAVGRLAGGIAHDFNNLLVVILGFADLALDRLGANDPGRADLEQICRAGERAAELIRQLLAFSRRQLLNPEIISLNDVVLGLETMLHRLVGNAVVLRTNLHPNLPLVLADPGQIEQVLVNLVVNGRQAMPTGGILTLETLEESAPAGRSLVVLRVRDTGQGMDAATKAKVFEPFFTTKPQGEGTGLGLATAYGIVKQSGGTIAVETELGRGTTFIVTFPADTSGKPPVLHLPAEERLMVGGSAETVLVVEPDEHVRDLAYRFLSTAGYDVIAVPDAEEGERAFRAHGAHVDLLLTEVALPVLSGEELGRRLRADDRDLRVLYMTDSSGASPGEPTDDELPVVTKPFTRLELSRRVRDVLDQVPG